MQDYILGPVKKPNIITHNMPLDCQMLLSRFQIAVEQAVSQGIKYDTEIIIDCWEFGFGLGKNGPLPSIYHANFKPKNW